TALATPARSPSRKFGRSLLVASRCPTPLTQGFVEQHARCYRDIQTLYRRVLRQTDQENAGLTDHLPQPCTIGAPDKDEPTAQVGLPGGFRRIGIGAYYPQAALFQEIQGARQVRYSDDRGRFCRPYGDLANGWRELGRSVTGHDDCERPAGIGGAK